MGKVTGIQWTKHTWNPWMGCSKVSEGCKHCYAERDMERWHRNFHTVTRTARATFQAPLRWKEPARIFPCSWSDFFHPDADEWRDEAWDIIRRTPHTYQILTKRPQFIRRIGGGSRLPRDWGEGYPNVWLGVSAENQMRANERIPLLLEIPARVHFLSLEPLLGPIDLRAWLRYHQMFPPLPLIDWVITGGESGPDFRVCDKTWVMSLLEQCREANVPFFFKQWGGTSQVDNAWGGDRLDGVQYHEFPEGA